MMTTAELVEILTAFAAGPLTRAGAVERMLACGEVRQEAEQAMALHLGESRGDVLD